MKKVLGSLLAVLLFPSLVFAADIQMPSSALSNVAPNDQKVVSVAEFNNLGGHAGQNPRKMTIRELVSSRPTIGSADDMRLCVVESISNPERIGGGFCVSARTSSAIVTVATFKNATGTPINGERTIAVRDFVAGAIRAQAKGAVNFDCIVKDGKNSGVCVMASNE